MSTKVSTPRGGQAGGRAHAGSTTDAVLLRRFGWVRAVGLVAYVLVAAVLAGAYGVRTWPLAVGVTVLAVASVAFFRGSPGTPRSAVVTSLVADAVVVAGTVAVVGGSGSGALGLYAIVVVSAGTLFGTGTALAVTALVVALATGQFGLELLGFTPPLLYEPELSDRLPVFLFSLAGLVSVGYLSATYAGRLHELVEEAGVLAEGVRQRGRRRRRYVRSAAEAVQPPLRDLEAVAAQLADEGREDLAVRVRAAETRLEQEIAQLADVGAIDEAGEVRPEPLALSAVVEGAVAALGDRAGDRTLTVDVGPLVVLGEARAARRVVFNLLENAAEHTPPGSTVTVTARAHAGSGVLVVADDGPGVPPERQATVFDPPVSGGGRVGLPLVRELCEAMGAQVRLETPRSGRGTRVLVAFRLAPGGAVVPASGGRVGVDGGAVEPVVGGAVGRAGGPTKRVTPPR